MYQVGVEEDCKIKQPLLAAACEDLCHVINKKECGGATGSGQAAAARWMSQFSRSDNLSITPLLAGRSVY